MNAPDPRTEASEAHFCPVCGRTAAGAVRTPDGATTQRCRVGHAWGGSDPAPGTVEAAPEALASIDAFLGDDAASYGTCAVCGRVAPLLDDECPDCRH